MSCPVILGAVQESRYRFGFNGQERQTELGPSYTTAEYWMYDGRLGRRWNVDPVVKQYESSYASFANNPIFLIDPNGADTININDKGVISGIMAAKGNHVLFDHKNQQLQFNDPEYDTELINRRNIKIGDQLVNYVSESELAQRIDDQGVIKERSLVLSNNFLTVINTSYNPIKAGLKLKEMSYNKWDFSHSVLGPMVNADANKKLGNVTRGATRSYKDDYAYEQYDFFVFGKTNQVYNLGDAGNFMWGMAGRRNGFSWLELKIGSNWNEFRQGRGLDTDADQKAIKNGFKMGGE